MKTLQCPLLPRARRPSSFLLERWPTLQPRLIAAFGTQRNRYANASELQAYSGIAP